MKTYHAAVVLSVAVSMYACTQPGISIDGECLEEKCDSTGNCEGRIVADGTYCAEGLGCLQGRCTLPVQSACVSDDDCHPFEDCTTTLCIAGTCRYGYVIDGTACGESGVCRYPDPLATPACVQTTGMGGAGGTSGTGGAGGGAAICHDCACAKTMDQGGCSEVCAMPGANGTPNFCQGGVASVACTECTEATCGDTPAKCFGNPGHECHDCACSKTGCDDACGMDFCAGAPASAACGDCIASTCGAVTPGACY